MNCPVIFPNDPQSFDFKTDIKLSFYSGVIHTVQDLLDLTDDKFNGVYTEYQNYVARMLTVDNRIDVMIQTMENVVLERRIAKLENQLKDNIRLLNG